MSGSPEHDASPPELATTSAPSGATEHVAAPVQAASMSGIVGHTALPAQPSSIKGTHGAAEHIASALALAHGVPEHSTPVFLDLTELAVIRTAETKSKRPLHNLARKALNDFANSEYDGPICLDDLFPWKAYLALHAEGEMLVGPGISRAIIDQISNVKDPNRGGRPHSDFIFHRVDGSAYRVHPGSKRSNDAAPIYCPCSRATEQTVLCVWHSIEELQILTFEEACRISQIDKIGKQAAFRMLQSTPEQFKWWLFAANLGPHTARVIGNGLRAASLVEHSASHAILRFQRFDGTTIDVEIIRVKKEGFKTLIHG